MITEKQATKISKMLSLVLRHQPQTIGIFLDINGWTEKRYAFNEAGDKIRASQGHSAEVELGYTPTKPPVILYHGTGEKWVASILKTGLEKRGRQHVHLSADKETAIKVGQRHGKPFVFAVLAAEMYTNNYTFYLSDNGVWLTDAVPVTYLMEE